MATTLRKKSIIITIWIYIGFAIGAINTILFTNKFLFLETEYGLTRGIIDIAIMLSSFAAMGAPVYVLKFFPYYNKRLPYKQNDLFANGFLVIVVGFLIVMGIAITFSDLFVKKYSANAPLLVHYFYWTLPLAFGYLFFSLLDGYAWNYGLQQITNILKEVILRIYVLLLILLYVTNIIPIHLFFVLFSMQYLFVCSILLYYLVKKNAIHFYFKISKVTFRFRKQIVGLLFFGFSTTIVGAIKIAFDSIVLASLEGLAVTAQFTFVSFAASLLQAPFRSMVSIYMPKLILAWKDKKPQEINRIYQRSSINLLLFSIFLFGIIWINFEFVIQLLHLNPNYSNGKWVLLVLCLTNIVELGTGLNAQIIQSSARWRFEFKTNLLLVAILVPCTYFFTKQYGIMGPAYASLLGCIIYNTIRIIFLRRRYNFFPFTNKTMSTVVVGLILITGFYLLTTYYNNWLLTVLLNAIYAGSFLFFVLYFNITPDAKPIVNTILKRVGVKKQLS